MQNLNEKNRKRLSFIAALLIPQIFGGVGAAATNSSVKTWYPRLKKPAWNPPSAIFPVVWTTLYLMMGSASWLIWSKTKQPLASESHARKALSFYGLQLVFNMLWSVIFFGLRRVDLALGEITVLWSLIMVTITQFFRLSPLAGWLLVPYQLWTTFAAALNAAVWWLNRDRG